MQLPADTLIRQSSSDMQSSSASAALAQRPAQLEGRDRGSFEPPTLLADSVKRRAASPCASPAIAKTVATNAEEAEPTPKATSVADAGLREEDVRCPAKLGATPRLGEATHARGGALLHLLGLLLFATPTLAGPAGHWAPFGAAKTATTDIAALVDSTGRAEIGRDTEIMISPLRNGALPKPVAAPPGARCLMFEGASAIGSARMGVKG